MTVVIPSTAKNSRKLAGITPTAAGLNLLDDANVAAQRTTLGLGSGDTPEFTGIALGGNSYLKSDAADTLALRNGVSAQTLNIYNTYTNGSVFEVLQLMWSSNIALLRTYSTGTARQLAIGTAQSANLKFQTNNTDRWVIGGSSGDLIASTDNANDIGLSGANRPRTGYFGTSVVSPVLTANGGTLTADAPGLSITQTWNNAAVTFTGAKIDITNTASNASSKLLDVQQNGTSVLKVLNGASTFSNTTGHYSLLTLAGDDRSGQLSCIIAGIAVTGAGGLQAQRLTLSSSYEINADTILIRDAAYTIGQRNGTNAQAFNLYNTYTSGTNYERLEAAWSGNICTLQTTAQTGTVRPLNLANIGTLTSLNQTVTTSTPLLNLTQTWNAAGVAFNGLFMNITNTASAAASLPVNVQRDGTTMFSVKKNGDLFLRNLDSQIMVLSWQGTDRSGSCYLNGSTFQMLGQFSTYGFDGPRAHFIASNNNGTTSYFTLNDDGVADVLSLRRSTNAHALRIYNTYTSTTNYERLGIGWSTNVLNLWTEKGSGGGTARDLVLGANATEVIRMQTGSKLGFYGATPVTKPGTYTETNVSTDRAFDANATTLDELADVVGTLIGDLRSLGLLA